jgi:hypothetical protein
LVFSGVGTLALADNVDPVVLGSRGTIAAAALFFPAILALPDILHDYSLLRRGEWGQILVSLLAF